MCSYNSRSTEVPTKNPGPLPLVVTSARSRWQPSLHLRFLFEISGPGKFLLHWSVKPIRNVETLKDMCLQGKGQERQHSSGYLEGIWVVWEKITMMMSHILTDSLYFKITFFLQRHIFLTSQPMWVFFFDNSKSLSICSILGMFPSKVLVQV